MRGRIDPVQQDQTARFTQSPGKQGVIRLPFALGALVVGCSVACPASAEVYGHVQKLGRWVGLGWGDGYHACADGGCRPCADLPPKGFIEHTRKPHSLLPELHCGSCGKVYPAGTGLCHKCTTVACDSMNCDATHARPVHRREANAPFIPNRFDQSQSLPPGIPRVIPSPATSSVNQYSHPTVPHPTTLPQPHARQDIDQPYADQGANTTGASRSHTSDRPTPAPLPPETSPSIEEPPMRDPESWTETPIAPDTAESPSPSDRDFRDTNTPLPPSIERKNRDDQDSIVPSDDNLLNAPNLLERLPSVAPANEPQQADQPSDDSFQELPIPSSNSEDLIQPDDELGAAEFRDWPKVDQFRPSQATMPFRSPTIHQNPFLERNETSDPPTQIATRPSYLDPRNVIRQPD